MVKRLPIVGLALCVVAVAGYAYSSAADYNALGIEAYEAKDFDRAIDYFEAAFETAPQNKTVRRNLCNARQGAADSYAKEADFAEAVEHLDRAITIDPENPAPLVQLGAYYLRLDMVPEAIYRLEEAIELKPGNLDAHELLGEAYYRDNDISWARRQWDYVLEQDSQRKGLRERYEKAFREEQAEQGFQKTGSSHFRLSAPRELSHTVRNNVLRTLENAYRKIGRELGGIYPPGPIQVILYEADQFESATLLDEHVGAVYDGKIRTPISTAHGERLPEDEFERRLTHEYVHVVVRYIAGENVPWWLNEGLAETLSTDMSDAQFATLAKAYRQNRDFRLAAIETSQLKQLGVERLRLAYLQSRATVEYLWRWSGTRRMHDMLTQLAKGVEPEDALSNSFRRNYNTLQREVAERFRQ
ncbi:MAG: peptidase MA family metallohydrolase [Candidatus Hydrogenedentota bacterium]